MASSIMAFSNGWASRVLVGPIAHLTTIIVTIKPTKFRRDQKRFDIIHRAI